jgi:hypothetical protein
MTNLNDFHPLERPGYFGRRRDEKIKALNDAHGAGNWTLAWKYGEVYYEFHPACRYLYELSYLEHLMREPELLEWICGFGEVIDNAITNVQSGYDYTIQEAFSTHIQDIAVRNVLQLLGKKFMGNPDNLLTIRGVDSNGAHLNPGKIPFFHPAEVGTPSLAPKWAEPLSVEDFWQSNKWIMVRET